MSTDLGALAPIVSAKAAEVDDLRCAAGALWAKAERLVPALDLGTALRGGTVIAEMKRRSPSGGVLLTDLDPAATGRGYANAGAAGISVLTERSAFGGSLADLVAVREAVSVPLLRKDFTIDPIQIAESRISGADWVLLIVGLLDDATLDECLAAAERAKAHAIVEVHDESETRRAVSAGASCIGINNRDLRTLRTDLGTFAALRALIPESVVCVAESGVRTADDVRQLVREGADSVLVGEALMRSENPEGTCAEFVAAAREARS